ncbi:MOSC domain-containing protein [Actinospica robiniae]|uniref:MOSC domain-containing protein n=1 Tax=Actinospica robiniae TaxID=304901 RepID=UPI00040EB429|nr:MOSC domain-containing protein [Actinospica robiniae]
MNTSEVAAVAQLWRYPVKSMLGERVERSDVGGCGLAGDRRLALIDQESGKVASAKAPRVWRSLLACSAAGEEEAVRISIPGDKPIWSTDAAVDEVLSAYTGRLVHLADTPPADAVLDRSVPDQVLQDGAEAEVEATLSHIGGAVPEASFFDFAPLHLITTATLRRVAELGGPTDVDVRRFRPNLVLDTPESGFLEAGWCERELRIGESLRLRVIAGTPRCAVPTLEHGDLPRNPAVLRTLARHHRVPPRADWSPEPCAGVYAEVLEPGPIEVGDIVRIMS